MTTTAAPVTPAAPAAPAAPAEPVDDTKPPEGESVESLPAWARTALSKANSEAAKYRTEVRTLTPLAQKAKELEDAAKSDVDKLTERATTGEKRAETAEHRLLRLEIALAKGLTAKQAARLVGSSQEELEADADDMLADLGERSKPTRVAGKPRENLRGGGDPEAEPEETDPAKLAAKVPRRY